MSYRTLSRNSEWASVAITSFRLLLFPFFVRRGPHRHLHPYWRAMEPQALPQKKIVRPIERPVITFPEVSATEIGASLEMSRVGFRRLTELAPTPEADSDTNLLT